MSTSYMSLDPRIFAFTPEVAIIPEHGETNADFEICLALEDGRVLSYRPVNAFVVPGYDEETAPAAMKGRALNIRANKSNF